MYEFILILAFHLFLDAKRVPHRYQGRQLGRTLNRLRSSVATFFTGVYSKLQPSPVRRGLTSKGRTFTHRHRHGHRNRHVHGTSHLGVSRRINGGSGDHPHRHRGDPILSPFVPRTHVQARHGHDKASMPPTAPVAVPTSSSGQRFSTSRPGGSQAPNATIRVWDQDLRIPVSGRTSPPARRDPHRGSVTIVSGTATPNPFLWSPKNEPSSP